MMTDFNEYDAVDGVKKCRQCDMAKFTGYFANSDLFADAKMPVCIKCYRDPDGQEYITSLLLFSECKRCQKNLNIACFSVVGVNAHGALPHISNVCRDCSSARFKDIDFDKQQDRQGSSE